MKEKTHSRVSGDVSASSQWQKESRRIAVGGRSEPSGSYLSYVILLETVRIVGETHLS